MNQNFQFFLDIESSYEKRRPSFKDRNLDQYWIFWPREAASKSVERGFRRMKGLYDRSFNLTTSYRRDSDIPSPFGSAEKALLYARYSFMNITNPTTGLEELRYVEVVTPDDHIEQIMAAKKPGAYATWLVSDCGETKGAKARFQYVQRMIDAGLLLDGFGTCFDQQIDGYPWSRRSFDKNGRRLFQPGKLAGYKFYLAFENSIHCRDYISEKFWRNSLDNGLVPIVFGPHPDDVRAMAPPNSYIHTEDFSSPAELTRFLDYLDKNVTAYLEYHQWRREKPMNLDQFAPHSQDG